MRNIFQDLDTGLIFILDVFSDLYDFVHEYQIIMLGFFMPFAVYLFILFLDFFMDVSVIHYDKKVSFYDFKQHYKAVKRKKTEYKKLYDNPNLSVGEKSKKLQNDLKKKVQQQYEPYYKPELLKDIKAGLGDMVPEAEKDELSKKVYERKMARAMYGSSSSERNSERPSVDVEYEET